VELAVIPPSSLDLSILFLRFAAAALALAMTVVALLAYRRVKSARMAFMSAAFATFFVRVLFVEQLLLVISLPSEDVDLIRVVFDLITIVLFAAAVVIS
jgi:hypothetical protein